MSILNYFWKNKDNISRGGLVPVKPKPQYVEPIPELPISCIAQHILDDLDIKNIDKWKLGNTYQFSFIDNGKYQIGINYFNNASGKLYYSGWLIDLDYVFNIREKELFNSAINLMYNKLYEISIQEYKLKNQEKLKELFPECFTNK